MMRITKTTLMKTLFGIIFTGGMVLSSCTDNDDNLTNETQTIEEQTFDLESAYEISELENSSESINDILEFAYHEYGNSESFKENTDKGQATNRYHSDCVIITKEETEISKIVTLDYGDGCLTKRNDEVSGKIVMTIVKDKETQQTIIDSKFVDFYFNLKKVDGSIHKVRTRSNENGFPQTIINRDVTYTWADGSIAKMKGERKREWIEGFENRNWGDNVFLITGSWVHTSKNGTERISTILIPLKRVMACRFIVSGSIEIEKNDNVRTIDYGSGECDDLATLTKNGESREFHIRKKKR